MNKTIKNIKRTTAGMPGHYLRLSDLPDPEREAFKKFLAATCRNAPVPDGETPGNTAWWHDYQAFARGEDPYLGIRVSSAIGNAIAIAKKTI